MNVLVSQRRRSGLRKVKCSLEPEFSLDWSLVGSCLVDVAGGHNFSLSVVSGDVELERPVLEHVVGEIADETR